MKVYGFVRQPSGNRKSHDALLFRALNGRFTEKDMRFFFGEVSDAAVAAFVLTWVLSFLVDKWIDSGREGDEEHPWNRQPWCELLENYVKRNPPELHFTKDGSPFLVMLPLELHDQRGPSQFANEVAEIFLSQLPDRKSEDVELIHKLAHSAADPAIALYLQLLDLPLPARLFRCDGCGTYLMRARAPKRDAPIYRGSWCPECKGKGAARRTDKSRENRTNQMIGLAADVWPRWNQDRRHGERAEWVAQQVNQRLESDEGDIAKNWVTRHTKEIEAEVERRSYAKS